MKILLLIGILLKLSCEENITTSEPPLSTSSLETSVFNAGQIFADKKFSGGRLDGFKILNDSTYQVLIDPENTPINNSPWYSFTIWSEVPTKVILEVSISQDYKNRYIPKLSVDGLNWSPLDKSLYEIDSTSGTLRMKLELTPQKLWISSQENFNSDFINSWIDSLARSPFINKKNIGESVLGQPIPALIISEKTPSRSIILIGRQHSTEVPGGTMSLMSFVQTLLSNTDLSRSFREKFEILVFPLLNPDGVDKGNWRHNANGEDLNRDWILFNQPETKAVRDWLIDYNKTALGSEYSFGIDFHTSYSGPYLLTLDTIPHSMKPEITNEWINQIELKTHQKLDIRPRAQSLPYCYNWMINDLGIEAVTYEEGDEIDRRTIKNRAKNYATILMEVLLKK